MYSPMTIAINSSIIIVTAHKHIIVVSHLLRRLDKFPSISNVNDDNNDVHSNMVIIPLLT